MYSNYSGVIQEGTSVSYVVKNTGMSALEETGRDVPGIEVTQGTDESQDESHNLQGHNHSPTHGSVVIQTIPNAKPVSRYNTLSTLRASPSPTGEDQDAHEQDQVPNLPEIPPKGGVPAPVESFKLAVGPPHAIQKNLSIGSGNLASESGSSAYFPFSHAATEPLLLGSSHQHDDAVSSTSSSIPQLQTYRSGSVKSLTPTRTELNNVDPTVPQRSREREHRSSRSFLDRELNKIETELRSEMHDRDEVRAPGTHEGDSYSAKGVEAPEEEDQASTDQLYRNRRVPSSPARPAGALPSHSLPHIANVAKTSDDTGFEDITDEPTSSRRGQGASRSSTNRRREPRQHKHAKRTSGSAFDTSRLSQLLMITKGTLVGSEFANLGMQGDEKRALERLVDSLSRLTADMILDPDRYDEGIRRLNNAIKALDGF